MTTTEPLPQKIAEPVIKPQITDSIIVDSPPADTAPNVKRAKAAPSKPAVGKTAPSMNDVPYQPGYVAGGIARLYSQIAVGVGWFDPICGQALMAGADKAAQAWERAAKENDAIRRGLHTVLKTTVIGELVSAHAPIVAAIAFHHVPALRERAARMAEHVTASSEGSPHG